MKRYSEYKDSGVKWIGEIPGHWNAVSLKRVVKLINEKSNEQNIPYIALENIESFTGKILPLNEIEPDSICNKFKKDDVLFCKLRPYLTKCVSPSFDGKCTSELLVLRNFNGVANYLKYILLSPKLVMDINASTYGAKMPRANWNYIGLCHVPLPPLPEQEAIVTYLDTKVAKIDEYISIAEKKIAALEELKQTIIAEAVTRGIHKEVPMKDSGVFWQPQIPKSWSVTLIKHILYKMKRSRPINAEILICSNKGTVFKRGESKTGLISDDESIYQGVKSGDLLIHGMDTWHGAIAISNYNGMCTPVVHVCESTQNKAYIAYYLRNMATAKVFKLISNGVRQNTSDFRSWDKMGNVPVCLPPLPEQQEIVTYLDSKITNINQLCQAERSQIEKLKEYKQRLISDVVTGKVKVTND